MIERRPYGALLAPRTNGCLSERHLGKDVALEDLLLIDFKNFRCTPVWLLINIILLSFIEMDENSNCSFPTNLSIVILIFRQIT